MYKNAELRNFKYLDEMTPYSLAGWQYLMVVKQLYSNCQKHYKINGYRGKGKYQSTDNTKIGIKVDNPYKKIKKSPD